MWTKVTSNRMEKLLEALVERLKVVPNDPIKPEWIVIQNPGMRRYLQMEIAKALGVCANVQFLMPQRFINEVIACAIGEGESLLKMETYDLIFGILEAIDELWDVEEFHEVRTYLRGARREAVVGRKELLFADKIADAFGRYVTFRSEMVIAWNEGKDERDWQAMLWRAVKRRLGRRFEKEGIRSLDPAELGLRFVQQGDVFSRINAGFPERVHVFGITSLAPSYLSILEHLSEYCDVHLYTFSPSKEYFGDLPRTKKGFDRPLQVLGQEHPLLKCLGKLSADFQDILASYSFSEDKELFVDPAGVGNKKRPTMLEQLQSDILGLWLPSSPHEIEPDDNSIRIHACHTSMRQVEVLRDALLHLLDSDHSLEPHEIVVMCPDIETFSPLIHAVFGEPKDEKRGFPEIPYSIADRAPSKENSVAMLVLSLLEVANGRAKASEVLDILSMEIVRQRFKLTPDDLARIRNYVKEARVRWGLDREHKTRLLGVESDECTWQFGLDRLLLGLALPEGTMFGNVVASDAGGSVTSETLQKFFDVVSVLFPTLKRFREPKTLDVWLKEVAKVIEDFVPHDEVQFEQEAQELYKRLISAVYGDLTKPWEGAQEGEQAEEPVLKQKFDGAAFSVFLDKCMSEGGGSIGLLARGVTFCKMVPLRNIPFKVVALLGMDDGAFPRKGTEISFDKVAQNPKQGDRNPREEDLQMFLEAVLSARKYLVITYTSLDARTKKPLPPASPVALLFDALEESFRIKGHEESKDAVKKLVFKEHPLHPFSPRNFFKEHPWSFDVRNLEAARMLSHGSNETRTPFTSPVEIMDLPKTLNLRQLENFLVQPQKHFLEFHGFAPMLEDYTIDEEEQVLLEALQEYHLKDEVFRELARDKQKEEILLRLVRQGELPIGSIGRVLADAILLESAETLLLELKDLLAVEPTKVSGAIQLGDVQLKGEVELINRDYVFWTVGDIDAKRLLRAWVRHLWLLSSGADYSGKALLFGLKKNKGWWEITNTEILKPKSPVEELLGVLVDLYFKGLRFPLPFFLESSKAVAGSEENHAAKKALSTWSNPFQDRPNERMDPYVLFAFGDQENPSDIKVPNGFPDFLQISRLVWTPLLASIPDSKGG